MDVPIQRSFSVDRDVFDIDYQVSPVGSVPAMAAPTDRCASNACGGTGTCWSTSCSQCCVSSDWRTGC
jgi:hypothetical protein